MEKVVHGKTTIARVSGGMLSNVTFEKVVITDSAGAPFISVDSLTTDYSISDLFRKRILLEHAVFVRPNVVPRSLVVFGATVAASDDAALERMQRADFDSNREVVLASPSSGAF
jgi:hypothetical protein